jgi:hypothetical protein
MPPLRGETVQVTVNDKNTIKELKEDFALGGFSMKRFCLNEAAMLC